MRENNDGKESGARWKCDRGIEDLLLIFNDQIFFKKRLSGGKFCRENWAISSSLLNF